MAAPKGNQYALGNNGGRPTKYKPEYVEKIIEHFDVGDPHRESDTDYGVKLSPKVPPPTIEDFAHSIGVSVQTLHYWKAQHKEFSDAYARGMELQRAFLFKGAAMGVLTPNFVALAMKNLHGWEDKPVPGKALLDSVLTAVTDYLSDPDSESGVSPVLAGLMLEKSGVEVPKTLDRLIAREMGQDENSNEKSQVDKFLEIMERVVEESRPWSEVAQELQDKASAAGC